MYTLQLHIFDTVNNDNNINKINNNYRRNNLYAYVLAQLHGAE